MKLAVWMDPLTHIKPHKDSTLSMLQSAQKLGWQTYYFTSEDMFCLAGEAYAQMYGITIHDHPTDWATTVDVGVKSLAECDVILVRKDPPFNLQYIYATYLLEMAERAGVLVVNKPQSLRDANEKWFALQFSAWCPETLISAHASRIKAFWDTHKEIIIKPLDGMGGQGVFHVGKDGRNLSVIIELMTHDGTMPVMAQTYIPAIKSRGDKRIILIDGDPIPYALARFPTGLESRGNLAAGGRGVVVPIDDHDLALCKALAPELTRRGLYFVGIDVIGDYLTEINVTSPTCVREISKETGIDIAGVYMNKLADIRKAKGDPI